MRGPIYVGRGWLIRHGKANQQLSLTPQADTAPLHSPSDAGKTLSLALLWSSFLEMGWSGPSAPFHLEGPPQAE
jgi:hypothetical protein